MCGACGRAVATDRWSAVLAGTRARWQVARLLTAFLRGTGHPARVSAATGAWLVSAGTGGSSVAQTATQVWRAVEAVQAVDAEGFARWRAAASTTEHRALAEAGTAVVRHPSRAAPLAPGVAPARTG